MSLCANDYYVVELPHPILDNSIASLVSLYQPLVGTKALSLYLSLLLAGSSLISKFRHQHLCNILDVNIDELEQTRFKLEQFRLIRTYLKTENGKSTYLYQILPPLNVLSFIKHSLYSRLLIQRLGKEDYQIVIASLLTPERRKNDFHEISKPFDKEMLKKWDHDNEVVYRNLQVNKQAVCHNTDLPYDLNQIINQMSRLVFPIEARTQENIDKISEYIVCFGISEQQLKLLIGKCSSLEQKSLDLEKFKFLAQKIDGVYDSKVDKYQQAPILFLKSLQNNLPVTNIDRRLLEYLSIDLKMKNEVINTIVEYVLANNDQRLTKNYVEAIASSFNRANIDTRLKAINKLNDFNKNRKNVARVKPQEVLPEYYQKKEEVHHDVTHDEWSELEKEMKGLMNDGTN